ncbi:MAG TPA: hypothetical protein VFU49_12060 [Ktedonobacteraceae bacterium]|nr:hypothetical protein [Ktedonobacteraceae bacterium]
MGRTDNELDAINRVATKFQRYQGNTMVGARGGGWDGRGPRACPGWGELVVKTKSLVGILVYNNCLSKQ